MSQPELFPKPVASLLIGLDKLPELLSRVMPLKSKHRGALPGQIRALSTYLTAERDQLPRDYMNQPPLLSAYLNYFMPWNIYRQGRLLAGLQLRIKPGAQIVDLGAGPLTFLLALWLSRPQMHDQELNYLGLDRSETPLKLGRQLFRAFAEKSPWQVRTERKAVGQGRNPQADLLVMANLLNEMEWGGEARPRARDEEDEMGSPYDQVLAKWESQVAEDGAILLIEPGMRASGINIYRLREAALARGWRIEAPCPHTEDCPLPGHRSSAWCHFSFLPEGAPIWLINLSRKAKLPKERASLSFLLLTRGDNPPVKVAGSVSAKGGENFVRVVSESFDLPDWQSGRYGCSSRGLVLLQDKKTPEVTGPRSGDLLQVTWPAKPAKDEKSGAWILPRTRG